jgi:hypothetical protein
MSSTFFMTFNAQATIEQEISIIVDANNIPLVSKEELVEGLEKGEFYTSLNSKENPYIIRLLEGGSIQNIAVIKDSRVCTEEESKYEDFDIEIDD